MLNFTKINYSLTSAWPGLTRASLKLETLLTVETGGEAAQAGVSQEDFIYLGQTNIQLKRLSQVMDLARELEIKGDTDQSESESETARLGRARRKWKPVTAMMRIMY